MTKLLSPGATLPAAFEGFLCSPCFLFFRTFILQQRLFVLRNYKRSAKVPPPPDIPTLSSRAAKKFSTVKVLRPTTNLAVFLSVPQLFFFFPSLASQFFWIRQTTNRALCISSFWQALKVLTNDSLIQRKTGGGEGETDKNNRLPQPWGA